MRTRSSEKRNTTRSFDPTLDQQKQFVMSELGGVTSLDDEYFIRSIYHHVAPESIIDTFLRKSRFYSLTQRRWKLPRSCSKLLNSDFHTPFLNVVSSILKHFWGSSTSGCAREVVDSHATDLRHCEVDSVVHHSRPSLVIKAEGPSFQLPYTKPDEKPLTVGYSNIASCIDIHAEQDAIPIADQLVRVAIYARQIFIHQPNRRFARILVLTQQHVRLFHFDRSGVQYTPLLDFHENPQTFVRLILGLSSLDESDIGLDTSIQWNTGNGRKVGGTLKTRGPDNEDVVYRLTSIRPFFFNGSIRGRSTICWSVRDTITNEELVVKDSWRSGDQISEHLFLQEAIGVPGVVQMVSCEPDRCETRSLRCLGDTLPGGFRNRKESRIVMKTYGKSVKRYKSAKELFCALRDAIAGHMEMFKKGALHRDVSPYNVLLGKSGADPGYRGVLIDFDIAMWRKLNKIADCRMGTRLYQSVSVLKSCKAAHPLPHDHLDDLESFLYILVQIMWTCDPDGVPQPDAEQLISGWEESSHDCSTAATLKGGYLRSCSLPIEIQERWPSPCVDAVIGFNMFIDPLMRDKRYLAQFSPAARKGRENVFATDAIQHYTHILQIFDTAIEALDRPETWRGLYDSESDTSASPDVSPSRGASIVPECHRSSLKRVSDDCPGDQPAAKRSRSTGLCTIPLPPISPRSRRIPTPSPS